MQLGERLKMLRKQNRMTLEDVAKHIDVGRATVSRYENGQITNIPRDKIILLSELFNVSPAFLMGWKQEQEEPPDIPQTAEARLLAQGIDRLSKEQREKALAMFRVMFEPQFADLFTKGNADDET